MAKFCGKCGARLDELTGKCPDCDKEVKPDTLQFSDNPLGQNANEAGSPQDKPSKKEIKDAIRVEKKQAKKAKKKAKKAAMSTGQKIRGFLLKFIGSLLLLAVLAAGAMGTLVYFDIVKLPFVAEIMTSMGILQSDKKSTNFTSLAGKISDIKITDGDSAIAAAQDAGVFLGLEAATEDLTVNTVSPVGELTYYRLQQNYKDIPVYGRDIIVIADDSGNSCGTASNLINIDEGISMVPTVTNEEILEAAKNYAENILSTTHIIPKISNESLIIFSKNGVEIKLAYLLELKTSGVESFEIIVDANSAEILQFSSSLNTIIKEGRSGYNNQTFDVSFENNQYILYDENDNIPVLNLNGNNSKITFEGSQVITSDNEIFGDTSTEKSLNYDVAIDLYCNIQNIYRLFKNEFGILNPYPKLLVCYDDMYDNGKNARGGDVKENELPIGFISMGRSTGVKCIDVLAHEYTHVVSRGIVGWNNDYSIMDENSAINEALSDIIGIITEDKLEGSTDWCVSGMRNIADPHKTDNPNSTGDKLYTRPLKLLMDGLDFLAFWTETGNFFDDHFFSTIISHSAYLMTTGVDGKYEKLSMDELGKLWLNSMLTFPSNCSFNDCREAVELTASVIGMSDEKRKCISAAFEKVGIEDNSGEYDKYSTDVQLKVYDRNFDESNNYTVIVDGKKDIAFWGLFNEPYHQKIKVTEESYPPKLLLSKGEYTVTVSGNTNMSYSKKIKTDKNCNNTLLRFSTNFDPTQSEASQGIEKPSDPVRTTSDERDIVIVLDVSGSMSGTPMDETKKASTNFIETVLKQDASIGIVTYNKSATMVSDFSVNESPLKAAASSISDGGGTNIEAGLEKAKAMLESSSAKKKIIVLMSDGEPNEGKVGEELISYADSIKQEDISLFTLGFFESLDDKVSAQALMEGIASEGRHYEVENAENLFYFFEDIADQINGQQYIYIRIACPVDVSVSYEGETLSSNETLLSTRTSFGSLTFEEQEEDVSEDRIKVLRLKDGVKYDVKIEGTGRGRMNYTIGFMDEEGSYSDFRRFRNVPITRNTSIDTVAEAAGNSVLKIDENGDGKIDMEYKAGKNEFGRLVDNTYILYIAIGVIALGAAAIIILMIRTRLKRWKKQNMK